MAAKISKPAGMTALTGTMLTILEEAGDLAIRPAPTRTADAIQRAARLQKLTADAACLAAAMAILVGRETSKIR
jgi:hypothetical protein